MPKEKFKKEEKIIIKIPMQAENEMENHYSISDLEIGKVTLIGIYRGSYEKRNLDEKLNRFLDQSEDDIISVHEMGIAGDDIEDDSASLVHYIDIIAVVQDISF